jgi:hypothetical protein
MTRADTLARARRLDRPDTAYVVRFAGRDGAVDTEESWAELARDTAWTAARLRGLGLAAGQRALLNGSGFEGPWLRPLMDALREIGVTYGIAEAMGWDANRTLVFARELDLHAVIGLPQPVLERLGDDAALRALFGGMRVVLARPAAAALLRQAGIPAGVIGFLGPALAIECGLRQGAHVNAAEWTVGQQDGALWIAAARGRCKELGRTVLAVRGTVVSEPCACGSADPRVLFEVDPSAG